MCTTTKPKTPSADLRSIIESRYRIRHSVSHMLYRVRPWTDSCSRSYLVNSGEGNANLHSKVFFICELLCFCALDLADRPFRGVLLVRLPAGAPRDEC